MSLKGTIYGELFFFAAFVFGLLMDRYSSPELERRMLSAVTATLKALGYCAMLPVMGIVAVIVFLGFLCVSAASRGAGMFRGKPTLRSTTERFTASAARSAECSPAYRRTP